ncbi:hypothetical protein DD238_000602 [Peronospora effusa]|uniref:Uncharacterized protein n=1 Tax=Peronospora effusa TaxID=542832 RepID=A0A3M6VSS9_9STRA|nr:hypothetical protein DD238_000602 [Peronospora effusa]
MISSISFPLAAISKIGQGNFNRFWYSNMLFGIFLIVMSFHGAASWLARSSSYIWITPPFLIYLVERRFRYAKLFAAPRRISEMDRDNVIETHQYLCTLKSSENTSQFKMFQEFVHEQTGKDFVSGLNTKQLTHFGRPD